MEKEILMFTLNPKWWEKETLSVLAESVCLGLLSCFPKVKLDFSRTRVLISAQVEWDFVGGLLTFFHTSLYTISHRRQLRNVFLQRKHGVKHSLNITGRVYMWELKKGDMKQWMFDEEENVFLSPN